MEYRIQVRNHWWFDAGIVGLYFIADQVKREENYDNIDLKFDTESLTIYGGESEDKIREFWNIVMKSWHLCIGMYQLNHKKKNWNWLCMMEAQMNFL